jgi:hypothetical protein
MLLLLLIIILLFTGVHCLLRRTLHILLPLLGGIGLPSASQGSHSQSAVTWDFQRLVYPGYSAHHYYDLLHTLEPTCDINCRLILGVFTRPFISSGLDRPHKHMCGTGNIVLSCIQLWAADAITFTITVLFVGLSNNIKLVTFNVASISKTLFRTRVKAWKRVPPAYCS